MCRSIAPWCHNFVSSPVNEQIKSKELSKKIRRPTKDAIVTTSFTIKMFVPCQREKKIDNMQQHVLKLIDSKSIL